MIHYDDKSAHSMTVTLEPWMTVKGRFVDASRVRSNGDTDTSPRSSDRKLGSSWTSPSTADADGRFVFYQIAPGAESYSISLDFFEGSAKVVPVAGKTADLGEIKVKSRNSVSPKATKNAARENPPPSKAKAVAEVNEVHGRVLLPDGKPAAGAKVVALRRYWVENVNGTPLAKTTAGPDGAFSIAIPQNTADDGTGTGAGIAWIGAEIDGLGTGYEVWRKADPRPKELVIKLLPEVPIHGRIVDLEGKPVAGGTSRSIGKRRPAKNSVPGWNSSEKVSLNLNDWLSAQNCKATRMIRSRRSSPTLSADSPCVGSRADRVIRLALHGDRIADTSIDVIARPIKPFPRQTGGESTAQVFGADFTFEAAPTRLIVGTVRDGSTGMPLGGVSIRQFRGSVAYRNRFEGKYRLVGLPKLKPGRGWESRYEISILPNPDQPYLALKQLDIPVFSGPGPDHAGCQITSRSVGHRSGDG